MSVVTDWRVGDEVERVSDTMLSAMPLNVVGIVTDVDEDDPDQPVCINDFYWPYAVDIKRVFARESEV